MSNIPRRDFIKTSSAIAAAACVTNLVLPKAIAEESSDEKVAMLIDTSKCTGCRSCIIACNKWNGLPLDVNKFHVVEEGRPRFSSTRWVDVVFKRFNGEGRSSNENWLYTRFSCMHCTDAACVKVCPVGAIEHSDLGTVDINPRRCIGCNYCIANCTFNVIGFDRARNIARKCTLCSDRLARGMIPACAQACLPGAITYGSRKNILITAGARVEELKRKGSVTADIYGQKELEGLAMIYVLEKGLENSEANYALPENPQVPQAANFWSTIFKPFRSILVAALFFALWVNKGDSTVRSK